MPSKSQKKKSKWLRRGPNKELLEDEIWKGASLLSDIVVVVMGPTGVGKSTFVDHLLKGAKGAKIAHTVKIGDDLESCTVNLQPIPIPAQNIPILAQNLPDSLKGPDSRLVIVDTPGFDDTYADDSVILKRIATWLAVSYSKDMKLGGVIYLHDISQPRMLGTTRRNFEMFQVLCGKSAAQATILGTTKWGAVDRDMALKREVQLRQKFWNDLTDSGAKTARFENTSGSAWKIVEALLNPKTKPQTLRIQEELVELEKIIPTTEAGKKLRYTLQEVLEMQKNSGDEAKIKEKMKVIESLAAQIDSLKVPLLHRIKLALLGGG